MKKINALIGQGLAHTRSSQKGGFPLAGPLSLIFSSTKVTATGSAGVTVSMTSEDSAGYANLSSPESASAKSRHHRSYMQRVTVTSRNAINGLASSHMVVGCADNLLNIKPESAFVQTTGKEKEPRPALLSTSMISFTGELNELHHNLPLQATDFAECQWASHPLGSMPRRLNSCLASSLNQLLRVVLSASAMASNCSRRLGCIRIWNAGDCPPVLGVRSFSLDIVHTLYSNEIHKVCTLRYVPSLNHSPPKGAVNTKRGLTKPLVGVTVMAEHQHTQTRPEFLETYWIVPCYSTTPYGKVSFTRQDRRTFIALFKDSRLIWAGRQPVKYFTENVKRTESPKLPVKGTEPRSQFNQSPGLLVRKMPHEGIEEISIPQGGVNITSPSTITEIVTVQGVAHV